MYFYSPKDCSTIDRSFHSFCACDRGLMKNSLRQTGCNEGNWAEFPRSDSHIRYLHWYFFYVNYSPVNLWVLKNVSVCNNEDITIECRQIRSAVKLSLFDFLTFFLFFISFFFARYSTYDNYSYHENKLHDAQIVECLSGGKWNCIFQWNWEIEDI